MDVGCVKNVQIYCRFVSLTLILFYLDLADISIVRKVCDVYVEI